MANNVPNTPIAPPMSNSISQATINIMTAPIESLSPEQLQHRRNILEAKKMERENSLREDAENQLAAARKANSETMLAVHAADVARQNACTHIKPRGVGTALAGQKTHRGYYVLVCQYCAKPFSDPPQRPEERIPSHLMPDMSLVGGPH